MAARRQALPLRKRIERHEADTWNWLSAVERLLQTGGLCFVLVGDSVVDETLPMGAADPSRRRVHFTSGDGRSVGRTSMRCGPCILFRPAANT